MRLNYEIREKHENGKCSVASTPLVNSELAKLPAWFTPRLAGRLFSFLRNIPSSITHHAFFPIRGSSIRGAFTPSSFFSSPFHALRALRGFFNISHFTFFSPFSPFASFATFCSILFVFLPLSLPAAPVTIEYFFEHGCPECEKISTEILPVLQKRHPNQYTLMEKDLNAMTNYLTLARYQEQLGNVKNEPVYMVVNSSKILSGLTEIRSGLFSCFAPDTLPDRQMPDDSLSDREVLAQRMRRFTVPTVLAAGLIDGVNPCVMSTLVFFMSVLIVSRFSNRRIWMLGLCFCAASFATYALLGFGLFHGLRAMEGFGFFRLCLEWIVVVALLVLAALSFVDAIRFRKHRSPESITLRLPDRLKKRINATIKSKLHSKNLVLAGITLGVVITIVESVCTGQVYAPTLVLMIKNNYSTMTALTLLLAYNIMFILPLFAVLAITASGTTSLKLVNLSKRNVITGKLLIGTILIILSILMLLD